MMYLTQLEVTIHGFVFDLTKKYLQLNVTGGMNDFATDSKTSGNGDAKSQNRKKCHKMSDLPDPLPISESDGGIN